MANDISNLLGRFGRDTNGYLEVDSAFDYKELPHAPVALAVTAVRAQAGVTPAKEAGPSVPRKAVAAALSVAASTPPLAGRVEPVIGELPVSPVAVQTQAQPQPSQQAVAAPLPTAASMPVMMSSLRSLLNEATLKREAEAKMRARHEDVAPHASLNALPPATPAQVIAIVSPKGGVGKSTMCAALAGAFGRKGRVIAIDLDPQNALQHHMGAGSDVAQADVAAADAASAGESWNWLLREGAAGTRVLPYEALAQKEHGALEQRMQQDSHWLARQLAHMHLDASDVVMLDTPTGRTPYLEQALDVADHVVVVVTPDAASFLALDHFAPILEGRENYHFILNQFDAARTFCQDMLEVFKRRLGTRLIGVVPLEYAISEGLAYGSNPLLEGRPSPALQEVLAIGDALASQAKVMALAGGRAS